MLRAENLSMRYFRKTGQANHFFAVQNANLTLQPGEVALLTGRSGSGKTTLLHMLAGLLTPTEGRVWLDETDLYALPDGALSRLRNAKFGVIPQGRSAVDTLTVLENVLLPQQLRGEKGDMENALRWLDALGIADLVNARPAELSGGELRRMAIARALAGDPEVIMADEPTGDLDDENTAAVLTLLRRSAVENGKTVLLVTHDSEALPYGDRVYRMESGVLRTDDSSIPAMRIDAQNKAQEDIKG